MSIIDRPVVIDWQLSSYFGWGVNGLHFMLNWALQQPHPLLTSMPVNEAVIDLNPIEWARIRPALDASRELQLRLEPFAGGTAAINFPLLHALGNDLRGRPANPAGVTLSGAPDIALAVFEATDLSAAARERARAFAPIIVASRWNRDLLADAGIEPVALVAEGIDPTTFHPAPRAGFFTGRFTVFSGGKLEYRKGQDLVLKAFRAFARRHPEALLVTAWSSPWPQLAQTFNADPTLAPVTFTSDGGLDATAWAVANGIAPGQIIALGTQPNSALARIYREMDVALFAGRCEGGTNMVAMECMACGVPVILSGNTGHLDLIAPGRCFALERQAEIGADGCAGWGDSDIEEIVETLEAAYRSESERRTRGERGAAFMRTRTWAHTASGRAAVIAAYVGG